MVSSLVPNESYKIYMCLPQAACVHQFPDDANVKVRVSTCTL